MIEHITLGIAVLALGAALVALWILDGQVKKIAGLETDCDVLSGGITRHDNEIHLIKFPLERSPLQDHLDSVVDVGDELSLGKTDEVRVPKPKVKKSRRKAK